MATRTSPHFETLRSWLTEIRGEKSGAAKNGASRGQTSHPSKSVDDKTKPVSEGDRSSENTKDVKDMVPANVDDKAEKAPDRQDQVQYNIGLNQSATGEDSKSEDNYKDRPEDPGTSHPANTSFGHKYGSASDFAKAATQLGELGNELLAAIAVGQSVAAPKPEQSKSAAAPVTPAASQSSQSTQPATASTTDLVKAAVAGYELAAKLGMTKEAADKTAQEIIGSTIQRALNSADLVGHYIVSEMVAAEKAAKAAAENPKGEESEEGEDASMAAGGAMPPGEAPPEAMPPGAEAGMPAGEAGMEGGGGGGEGSPEHALQELAMALMELGITPEELAAAVQGGGAGGAPGGMGGGMPPGMPGGMGGGAPPMMGSPADMGAKLASAVRDFRRSGKFEVRSAKDASERQKRNEYKSLILELMGATRQ